MPAARISFHAGSPAFSEIHIPTFTPLAWLASVRYSLAFLLEGFHEPLPVETAGLRGYAIWLLYSLHPLPAQMKAGTAALHTAPGMDENEGYYFTPGGLVIRLQVAASYGELHLTLRALLAVGQYSGYSLSDEVRAGYFELLGALTPSPADVSAAFLAQQ